MPAEVRGAGLTDAQHQAEVAGGIAVLALVVAGLALVLAIVALVVAL